MSTSYGLKLNLLMQSFKTYLEGGPMGAQATAAASCGSNAAGAAALGDGEGLCEFVPPGWSL